jgi:hypothetical protein
MAARKLVVAITLFISTMSAALAQSAYTSGTIASSERAGYPSPEGYGTGLYAYVPGYDYRHVAKIRR